MRKILSFLTAILFAGSMMATLPENPQWEAKALADIADGSTLIIISNSTTATNVALPSTATSSNPAKKICEVTTAGGVTTITAPEGSSLQDLAWTLVKSGDNYKFYQEGSEEIRMYLTGLSTNTGLRIGNANSVNDEFVMGDLGQLLKVTTGTRFVGPNDNNGSDWRTYNTENGTNYKGAALTFYVLKASQGGDDPQPEPQMKTIYCKMEHEWWTADGAAIAAFAWKGEGEGTVMNAEFPGVRMTAVENEDNMWKIDLDLALYEKVIFARTSASGEVANWGAQTEDLVIPTDDNNLFTISTATGCWTGEYCKVEGAWSVYGEGGGDTPEPPTPAEKDSIFFVNVSDWEAVRVHLWGGSAAGTEWPGVEMTKEAEQINGHDVYKFVADEGAYANCIFNNNDNGAQTADLDWNSGKYFYDGTWYAKENIPADEPAQPEADFTQPFTLKFNGTGNAGSDASGAFAADVAAIFTAASAPYVASIETATKVYAGRPIFDDNSSVKFGTSSAQGTLAFTLAQAIEVDSIIVNATQYGSKAAEVTINGTKFDLTAGNKVPQDCKITPEGEVSTITIEQTGTERIYLRNVRIYPKTQGGGDDPQPEPQMKTIYCKMEHGWWTADGAAIAAFAWKGEGEGTVMNAEFPGVRMTAVEGVANMWKIDLDLALYEKVIFARTSASGEVANWGAQTEDLTIPTDDNNLYTISTSSECWAGLECKVEGAWSVYGEGGGDTPEPPVAEKDSIFFVNASDWIALRVHLWGGSAAGTEWPGVEMTPVAEKINSYEVFKLIVDKGAYANCIFNNNDHSVQTANLDWNSGKYFYKDAWYAKEAIPAETPVTTFVGFDAGTTLGTQLAAGLAKNRVNVTFDETSEDKYSVNLVEGGVESSFTLGGVVFAYKNSAAGATAWKTYLTYIQPNGKDREVRIPLEAGKKAKVVLYEACAGVLVNGESTDLVAGENILTATADGIILKSASTKPKIQAILPVDAPEPPVAEKDSIFFVNASDWEAVRVHLWGGSAAGTEWPGVEMTKEAEQINGHDVYKLIADKGAYANCIFNNNDNGAQTGDLDWNSGKYFCINAWYAKEDIPVPANFYITGSANLVGEEKAWNADAIVVTENAYTFENLAAGDYKLKLTLDGSWETAIGFYAMTDTTAGLYTDADGNINFTLSAAADITVNFIKGEQGIATFTVTGSNFASPVVKLMGIDADWSTGVLLEDAADHKTASKTLTLAAAYQDFKLVVVTDWYGWGYEPGNQYEINRDYNFIDILVSKDEPNALKLNADAVGDYTFTYNYVTRKLTVDFPAAPVAEKDSIFFVNVANWGAVRVYLWGGSADATDWPGVEMTLEEEQINGHDVYKLIADKGAYANCIFSDNGNNQTGDLDWNSGKYYYVDAWYAKEDIPTVQPEDVVFTVNVPEGTDSVFIAGTFNDWTFEKMNHVEGLQYTITKNIVKNGIEYKYTAGRSWDYVEIRDGNRTAWAELDEVTEWLAVPQPAFEHHDFFITGNAALVGEELAWNPNAIPVDGNSYELHLGAGKYELKVVTDDCGASNCQQWFGCERLSDEQVEGVACVAATGNIGFTLAEEGNVTVNFVLTETDTIITLTGNFYNVPMVDIKLVPGEVWSLDEAKFAAVIWNVGQTMEYDGVLTGWFVGGDTVVAQIPENTDSIAFARFAPAVEEPFLNPEDPNFWNHTDKLAVDPSMIFTVMGGDVEGRNFCPGYWGEKPDFIADGYFLLGNFNGWTADADYWFTPYDENQYKVTVALAVNDELKVAKYDRGYRVQWFPNNADNYVVNEKHAGSAQDIYFRPDYQGSQDWYEGCIYVVDNGATAIDNTAIDAKAEKMLRNGMILIIKGDKTYNIMGQIVK